jgi:hypothetical protein
MMVSSSGQDDRAEAVAMRGGDSIGSTEEEMAIAR